jgi:DNA-binding SARP family transcriptional activator/tetratricopeptide (TPR) repeat protein
MRGEGSTLRILGPVELVGLGGPVRLGAAKERRLLAVLALRPGEAVSQERLAEALWGEHAPRSATNTLQNYVLRLRRALQHADGVQILTDPAGYRLEAPADAVDARLAERLIAEGREAAADDPATAARLLREALALWRGQALVEFSDQPFAQAEAARLEELRESAREDLVEADLALGRHHDLVGELEAMVASHPLRERRWGQLLVARYRDGRQAEALEGFHALRRTLREELGVDPGRDVQDLHQRILHQDPALAWRPPEQASAPLAGPLHGRGDELRRLLAAYETAAAGAANVVTVLGEAGIGKTRLLQELAATARRHGALVLVGRCLEGAWVPPYQAFVEAITGYAAQTGATRLRADLGPAAGPLRQLVPGLRELLGDVPTAEPLRPDEERLRLLDAVARFLAGLTAHGPVVLLLDDLQCADDSTLVTLRHIARVLVGHRLLLVGAYRTEEVSPELVEVLGALRTETEVTAVRLHGLAADALRGMLGALAAAPVSAALADTIQQETRGNPFFAREVLRHLLETQAIQLDAEGALQGGLPVEAVPEGLRDVLARRRARLTPAANGLLDVAAGFDGPFPFGVVAEVADLEDAAALAALDEVLDAGLVEPDVAPERYQFAHALIRHAVYADLNPSRRVRLHRKLAHALEVAQAASPELITPAEVAAHYHQSAVLPGADAGVAPALEAAEQAQAASAHGEAAAFLGMACELAPPGDPRLPQLRARLGLALAWALRLDEAVKVASEAAAELAAVEGRQAAAGYLAEVAAACTNADSAGHAWQLVPQGLAYAGERHDTVWATLALLDLDRREATDPQYPGIVLDLPERRQALGVLHRAGALTGRVDLLRYGVAAIYGTRQRIPPEVAEDSTVRLFLLGDYAGALPRFAAEAAQAHARGQLAREAYCHGCRARCHIALGQLEAGRAALAEAHAVAGRIAAGPWGWQRVHAILGTEHALVLATDEGWEELLGLATELSGTQGNIVRWAKSSNDAGMAVGEARVGRPDRALQLLSAVLPALQRAAPWGWTYLRTACDAAETLWLLDRRDHLPVIEAALRDKALPPDFRFPMMDARLALARLCALDGRHEEASRWFGEARVTLDAQGARPLRAIVDFDEALMHQRAGRPDAARPLQLAAVDQFTRLGMTGWFRRASAAGGGL